MKITILKIALTVLVLGLFSCNASKKSKSKNKQMLSTNYIVEKLSSDVELKTKPTLTFNLEGNKVSGSAGCNKYNGNLILNGNNIKIENVIATKMFCPNMPIEEAFFKDLSKIASYKIIDDKLNLLDNSNNSLIIL